MNLREGALVAFTLLMQTSVGVLLVVAALQAFASRTFVHGSARPFDVPLLVATVAAVLGLLASFLHLGHPLQAWLAVTNVRTSWLSREVLLASLFVACLAACVLLARTGIGSPAVRAASWLIAAILGVLAIAAMSRLYMVPAQPAWNRIATPVGFAVTTLLVGTVVVLFVGEATMKSEAWTGAGPARLLPLIAIGLLVVQVLLLPLQMSGMAAEPAAAISAASAGALATWLAAARAAAAVGAIALLAGWVGPIPPVRGVALLVLVFASEICGRVLFYAASVRLGPA